VSDDHVIASPNASGRRSERQLLSVRLKARRADRRAWKFLILWDFANSVLAVCQNRADMRRRRAPLKTTVSAALLTIRSLPGCPPTAIIGLQNLVL
jgi:hypothetical protein